MPHKILIPADVPCDMHEIFKENMRAITHSTERLFLFACDQKIEHLNADFYGPGIHADAEHPEHLFKIAQQSPIGAMATHVGLIDRYGPQYRETNYIAKINAKTNLIPQEQSDPLSTLLWDVHDVVQLARQSDLKIRGVGLTIYLGSEYEHEMLHDAAQQIFDAHLHGLIAILWMYPRGKAIKDEEDPQLLAGAAGIANALGADFVKIKPPHSPHDLSRIVAAAGNTKVICAGGEKLETKQLIAQITAQMHESGTAGCAIGRNLFQRSTTDAIELAKEISKVVYMQDQ
jgi:fructose-bisphosphate aldolase / 6-deoxy-5-ketofructose 1-phosphate synthase